MNQDRLEEIWEIQRQQQEMFNLDPRGMSPIDRARVAKDYILGLNEEVTELAADITHYKAHVLKLPKVERLNVAEEAADVLKYLVSICQLHSVTSEHLIEAFKRKTEVVNDRARCERIALERDTKVIISDLDGCIADLSGWQSKLADQKGSAPMNDRTVAMLESLKEDFYRGGGFLDIPPIPGAAEAIKKIRAAGYLLVIITARPLWQYKRLYGDTIEWLKKHDIEHDQIFFNKDKAEAIYENVLPARPLFFVEDRAKHCLELANIGVKVLYLTRGYNENDISPHPLINRVSGWDEIVKHMEEAR